MQLFCSHHKQDRQHLESVASELAARSHKAIWQHTENYGLAGWPASICEALQSADAVLLLWSRMAAESHFVNFELHLAAVFAKPVYVWQIDDSRLPAILYRCHEVLPFSPSVELDSAPTASDAMNTELAQKIARRLADTDETKPVQVLKKIERHLIKAGICQRDQEWPFQFPV